METTLTYEEAHRIITDDNFDGYGSTRLYGIIADSEECAGQVSVIKSTYHLDRMQYSRIYSTTRTGVPIFSA